MKVSRKFGLFAAVLVAFSLCIPLAYGRTFEFKALGSKGSSSGSHAWWGTTEKSKSLFFRIKVGGAAKTDDKSKMEIRAATVFKNIRDKRTGVNDVARLEFEPINIGKAVYFIVATGTAFNRTDNYWIDGRCDHGWQAAGCIIEIWQGDKVVKHWTNIPGNGGKTRLTNDVKMLLIDAKGNGHTSYYEAFDNATELFAVDARGEKTDVETLMAPFREAAVVAEGSKTNESSVEHVGKVSEEDFTIDTFCGYEFGSEQPDFQLPTVRMKRPFLHYDVLRPKYGLNSGTLNELRLESQSLRPAAAERVAALAKAVDIIERKYGIRLEGNGDSRSFCNEHVSIFVTPYSIHVRNNDWIHKEELLTSALSDANRADPKKAPLPADADVL